jgi:hypothetical protein
MGAAGRERVLAEYTWEIVAGHMMRYLSEVAPRGD